MSEFRSGHHASGHISYESKPMIYRYVSPLNGKLPGLACLLRLQRRSAYAGSSCPRVQRAGPHRSSREMHMKKFLLATLLVAGAFGSSITGAGAQSMEFTSATACEAAHAWDAKAARCVQCKTLVTDASSLKSCEACAAGTAFDIAAKRCTRVVVKK
jgi:hypothetical protein